jgi:Dynein heavy chain, N-terminal region 2
LTDKVIEGITDFHERITTVSKLFMASVTFEASDETAVDQHLVLSPSVDEFKAQFEKFISGLLESIDFPNEFVSALDVIRSNLEWKKKHSESQAKLFTDLEKVTEYIQLHFTAYKKIIIYQVPEETENILGINQKFSDIAKALSTLKGYQEELDKFKAYHTVGCILIDSRNLKAQLSPIPQNALAVLRARLLEISVIQVERTLEVLKEAVEKLSMVPSDLKSFMEFVQNFRTIRSEMVQINMDRDLADQMSTLMRQHQVKIPIELQVKIQQLQIKGDEFNMKILLEAVTVIDDQRIEKEEELKHLANMLEMQARKVNADTLAIEIADFELLVFLVKNDIIDGILSKSKELRKNAELLEIPQFAFEDIQDMEKLYNSRRKQIEVIKEIRESGFTWSSTELGLLDLAGIKLKLDELEASLVIQMEVKSAPEDGVHKLIQTLFAQWRNKLEILNFSLSFKARHWEKLFKQYELPFKGSTASTVAVCDLEVIFGDVEMIKGINNQATEEDQTDLLLEEFNTKWKSTDLPVDWEKDVPQIDVYEAEKFVELSIIDLSRLETQAQLTGNYVKDKIDGWMKKLNLTKDVLPKLLEIQKAFNDRRIITAAAEEDQVIQGLTKFLKELLRKIKQSYRKLIDAVAIPNLKDQLNEKLNQLITSNE